MSEENEYFRYCFAREFDVTKAYRLIEQGKVPFVIEQIPVKTMAEGIL